MKKFIGIAGNMGVGKTSLVEFFSSRYGFQPVYEPYTTNPYLDDFYKDMRSWGFHSQLWFLTHKFRLHLDLNDNEGTVIQDRTIYEDAEIFATNLYQRRQMKKRDYETYMDLYRSMRTALQPPDLLVYLRCDVKNIRRRIKRRGRPSEQAIPVSYIKKLNGLYEDWIDRYEQSPVLIWESGRQDYLEDLMDRLEFQRAVERFL